MSEHRSAPMSLAPEEDEAIWFMGTRMVVRAERERTGGAFSMIEVTHPPRFATPLHVHHREDEWFYVLAGEYTYFHGDTTLHARACAFVVLPRDIPHAFCVESADGGRVLRLTSPSGVEGFLREAGAPAVGPGLPPRTPIDMDRLRSLEAKYSNEHLGPPPQREA